MPSTLIAVFQLIFWEGRKRQSATKSSSVESYRYNSVKLVEIGDVGLGTNGTLHQCTPRHNSSFAGLGASLVSNTTIRNGQVVEPHDTGFRVVCGVLSLRLGQSVALEENMALEVGVGCMSPGIFASHGPGATGQGATHFSNVRVLSIYGISYRKRWMRSGIITLPFPTCSWRMVLELSTLQTPHVDSFLPDIGNTTDGGDSTRQIKAARTERFYDAAVYQVGL
ncbi:hypothetical protein WG66_008817 [Moniliophthora roreri]|uniref:Uncharacterized protein n=1 Tax=Moniliophthora roreri TaxID=221103 RepID=A0A0W0GEL5_MONRR|nr:hypothetical protein WG66_008817 [Moniliophthora roreri]